MRPEYRELLAVSGETLDAAPNVGRAQPMITTPAAGGLVTLNDTQLISARVDQPTQWLITVLQAAKPNAPTPWVSNFDGSPYTGAAQLGAPTVPQQAGIPLSALQMRIRWGAGGVRYQTAFDYPVAGGAFGVTADMVDIDVTLRSGIAQQAIDPSQIPVVGAFMVPGQAADPSPLRWLEADTAIAQLAGASWSVKPYARQLRVDARGCTKATLAWFILSGAAPNTQQLKAINLVEKTAGEGIAALVDVPAQAEIVGITAITNTGGTPTSFFLEWYMGLV